MLLRPDGCLVSASVAEYLLLLILRGAWFRKSDSRMSPDLFLLIAAGLMLTLGAFSPLVPWTIRNLRTMHRFEPLAPRYANDSDELVNAGFNRWTKTWMADYTSVQEVYWRVPGDAIDITRLPQREFDSARQRQDTGQPF